MKGKKSTSIISERFNKVFISPAHIFPARGSAPRGRPAQEPLDPLFVYLWGQKVLWGDKAPRSSGRVRRQPQCRFMGVRSGERD